MKTTQKSAKAQEAVKATLPPAAQNGLIVMTALMSMAIIIANYAAVKIWSFFGIPVDGGLLLFPVTYILGDTLSEIYGKKTANTVAWSSGLIGLLTIIIMAIVGLLPDYAGADNAAFTMMAGMTGRIFFASIAGFVASQVCNNFVFDRIRRQQQRKDIAGLETARQFGWRAFASSAVAHIPDILIFEPLAFLGRLTWQEFVAQAIFAYVAAIIVEILLLCIVTVPLTSWLAHKLGFRHGERYEI